jgi:hypothetical protein
MPAVREYIVRQTREVKIKAASPTDAVQLAVIPFSMSEKDNRDNNHPVPVEVDVSASPEF